MGCVCDKADVEAGQRQFKIVKLIAKGGFSQILLVEDLRSRAKWAMKRIECQSGVDIARVRREVEMHRRFGWYENVLPLECFTEDEAVHGARFSLIFPYCKRGSLQDELTAKRATKSYISQERVIRLFSQIVSAVSLLHLSEPPIAHRDLKPGNILMSDDDRPLLMDFGSCFDCPVLIKDSQQSRFQLDEAGELCSMPYRAPELFVCEIGSVIDQSIDIWALGCILYALCFFRSPFDDIYERGDSIALAVQSAKVQFESDSPYDAAVFQAIRSMVVVEPQKRPDIMTVSEMTDALK
ncbi:hypothetical protein AB6A40_000203 [Gnathostoma spinigerum]|uniref:non-specific serine/threonine protein kinase n=1 Tax=Gnathostoma spinigerum TaxID=75299 RepID=A0ABD6E5W5_9BILA